MHPDIGQNARVNEDLERRLAAARERVRELSKNPRRDTTQAWRTAWEQQLQAERDLAAARGEQYATVIDIGPRWDIGAPLPHLVGDGSRAFVACMASVPDPDWDGTLCARGIARGRAPVASGGDRDVGLRGDPVRRPE